MALFSAKRIFTRKRPRLGFADNMLTRPLVRGVEQVGAKAEIADIACTDVPAALAAGELDIALVPSIEVVRHPEYSIIPTVCVGTFGGGGVAILCSKVLPTEIENILIDCNGQAFSPVLEILLPRQVMIRPRLIESDSSLDQTAYDFIADPRQAFLLTGLSALKATCGGFFWTWDLMQSWKSYTSLPFVLWVWAVRPNVDLHGLDSELNSVLVGNLSRIDAMATEESTRCGFEKELYKQLYTKVLHYPLDNLFMAGFRRFAKEAADAGLVPGKAPIRLYSSR